MEVFFKKILKNVEFQGSDISARRAEQEPTRSDLSPDRGGRSRAAASGLITDVLRQIEENLTLCLDKENKKCPFRPGGWWIQG